MITLLPQYSIGEKDVKLRELQAAESGKEMSAYSAIVGGICVLLFHIKLE